MRIGLHLMNFSLDEGEAAIGRTVLDGARAVEDAGFDRLTVMDHWFQMEHFAPATEPMLEAYTTLGFVAAATERLDLGVLVTGVTYRYPALLAKTVTTLDVLSGGRAILGIGAAWYEREHLGLGVPYPELSERFERLEEAILIAEQMWSENDGPFDGAFSQLAETLCRPRPVRGRIPILIGGGGERKTLRLVAQYADAANLLASDPETVGHKIDVLRRHCDEVGRDFGEIQLTIVTNGDPAKDPDAFVESMRAYAALGVTQAQVRNPTSGIVEWAAGLGRTVVPRVADL
jgi:F420-dependent oxidoreductase-like protein